MPLIGNEESISWKTDLEFWKALPDLAMELAAKKAWTDADQRDLSVIMVKLIGNPHSQRQQSEQLILMIFTNLDSRIQKKVLLNKYVYYYGLDKMISLADALNESLTWKSIPETWNKIPKFHQSYLETLEKIMATVLPAPVGTVRRDSRSSGSSDETKPEGHQEEKPAEPPIKAATVIIDWIKKMRGGLRSRVPRYMAGPGERDV